MHMEQGRAYAAGNGTMAATRSHECNWKCFKLFVVACQCVAIVPSLHSDVLVRLSPNVSTPSRHADTHTHTRCILMKTTHRSNSLILLIDWIRSESCGAYRLRRTSESNSTTWLMCCSIKILCERVSVRCKSHRKNWWKGPFSAVKIVNAFVITSMSARARAHSCTFLHNVGRRGIRVFVASSEWKLFCLSHESKHVESNGDFVFVNRKALFTNEERRKRAVVHALELYRWLIKQQ